MSNQRVPCPYCRGLARLDTHPSGEQYGRVWICQPCQAWVGCHTGGTRPKGSLANAELRQARMRAHEAFDPLWVRGHFNDRRRAYEWLAKNLGVRPDDCHIGLFDVETCERVVRLCGERKGGAS